MSTKYTIHTIAERPDLRDTLYSLAEHVWAPFMLESPAGYYRWGQLAALFPEYESVFIDGEGKAVATAFTIPFYWDGNPATLPDGWDNVMTLAFDQHAAGVKPNTLSALAAEVAPRHQGTGLSTEVIMQMRRIAEAHGFGALVAPVRPSMKHLYPLISIERYARWERADGLPFDPWMRVHARLGAVVLEPCPRSMYIPGTVAQWEEWTGMQMPYSGEYVVKGALQPITVSRETDLGIYYDPNVWMLHDLKGQGSGAGSQPD